MGLSLDWTGATGDVARHSFGVAAVSSPDCHNVLRRSAAWQQKAGAELGAADGVSQAISGKRKPIPTVDGRAF